MCVLGSLREPTNSRRSWEGALAILAKRKFASIRVGGHFVVKQIDERA
jgi:hypothetical protein